MQAGFGWEAKTTTRHLKVAFYLDDELDAETGALRVIPGHISTRASGTVSESDNNETCILETFCSCNQHVVTASDAAGAGVA